MARFFLEVAYRGTAYSGFQSQENANTIQQEVEQAFRTLQRNAVVLTGSSRTDAGVHALQNFFHFDFESPLHPQFVYKINAILPSDIVVRSVQQVADDAHCRFDASSRVYDYFIYRSKDPFLEDRAWYFPYTLNMEALQEAAALLMRHHDFTSFSKRNTQVKTFECSIMESSWRQQQDCLVYRVRANRFLRGMVRALVATMLQVGRGTLSLEDFRAVIDAKDCTRASFAAPAHGLFLVEVCY
ncbi:MAG: tRNA pseudouridine(38-40) synthase TruA [Chitinophagales bacterium]|jgi:tRNA pseudouridine38-40 synthase|nr:tRNA pseudouridine(38-40) synthase TruA [Chitinophagales bacterium]